MTAFRLEKRNIGVDEYPFVIAEMSGNHNQSLERAVAIVEAAAQAGADAIKLQTYTADTMTLPGRDSGFLITDADSPWKGMTLHELYQTAATPWDWHEPLMRRAKELGLILFSTPFDKTAADFLNSLGVSCFKVASFENTDIPLIEYLAALGKPLIISTGMMQLSELDETVRAARERGCRDLVLLKCTSSYPASPSESNLRVLPLMRDMFRVETGISDHTLGIGAAVSSVALGASVIEKHLTLSRAEGGVDASFSLEPHEMAQLVREVRVGWEALGASRFGPTKSEEASLQFRRSLYVVSDLKAGDFLTETNVRAIRPGYGLPPKYLSLVLGRRISKDTQRGTPLSFDLLLD